MFENKFEFPPAGGQPDRKKPASEQQETLAEETPASTLEAEAEKDKEKSRLVELLREQEILEYTENGEIVFDMAKFKDPDYKFKFSLGRKEGKSVLSSKVKVARMFSDAGVKIIRRSKLKEEEDAEAEPQTWEEAAQEARREILKEKVLKKWEKKGILERKDGFNMVDMESIKNYDFPDEDRTFFEKERFDPSRKGLLDLLGDMKVVPKEEYERYREEPEKIQEKYLFNLPNDVREITDVERIKNKDDYYFNFWEINTEGRRPPLQGEIQARNGEGVSLKEFYLANKIYKDYDGYRDKDGNLIVNDPELGELKINSDWLSQRLTYHGSGENRKGILKYLREDCSNLLKSGLLKFEDFSPRGDELKRDEFLAKGNKLEVFTGSVKYYLGRKFFNFGEEKIPIENIKVSILDDNTAGVIFMHESKEELRYTLNLLSEEEKQEKREKIKERVGEDVSESKISSLMYLNKGEVEKRMHKFSPDSVITRKDYENTEDYENIRSNIKDYNYINMITRKFVDECGVGIHNLSWKEQVWLAAASFDMGVRGKFKDLTEFAQNYKGTGLKSFLAVEFDKKNGDMILDLGKKLEDTPEAASELFGKYAEMVDRMDEMAEEAAGMYEEVFFEKKADKDEVKNNLLSKASNILKKTNNELQSEIDSDRKGKIVKELLNELERTEKVQIKAMDHLKKLAKDTSKVIKQIEKKTTSAHLSEAEERNIDNEIKELEEKIKNDEFSIYGDKEKDREIKNTIEEEKNKLSKFDSLRIQKEIKLAKEICAPYENPDEFKRILIEKEGMPEEVADNFIENRQQDWEEIYKPYVEKLEKVLPLQQNLETQLDQFVYGITDLDKEDQNLADRVFSKYHELVDQAQKSKKEMAEVFKEDTQISEEELDKISENILNKAEALLQDFSDKILNQEEVDEEEVMKELEDHQSDMVFTAQVLATLKKDFRRRDVDVEDIKGVTFEEKTISDLAGGEEIKEIVKRIYEEEVKETPGLPSSSLEGILRQTAKNFAREDEERIREIKRMMEIYKENYKEFPVLQAKLLKGFTELLTKEDASTTLYTLKKENELLAFCRFTDLGEGKKEFGAFNVPESLHGSAIGSSFLKSTLEKEAEENGIYADCDSSSPISDYYINGNKGKFIANKVNKNYGDTGKNIFSIFRARQEQKQQEQEQYHYHDLSSRDIIKEYEDNIGENKIDASQPRLLLKFEKDSPEFIDTVAKLVNEQEYVMTNYVIDEKNGRVYAALEKG